ncbi:hypothetical protein DAMA08_051440 [Martiniozyma asiatica (nom. inval.)]|nr:hypothetical protein DAMA08_051440 [Martiniozyma asiatica]
MDLENFVNKKPHFNAKTILLNALETNFAGQWLKDYTKDNQLAGTNLAMVNYTLGKFKEFGLDNTYVDEYTSYISYPLNQSLILLQNDSIIYTPILKEDIIDEDANSKADVPAFLGYAANGNVTAEYVFCNYGTVEDFKNLIDLGVNLNGKIAVIRYGKIYRGLKIKFAQDQGMSAVLLYTDTFDDGKVTEQNGFDSYPNGPARNPSAIQRGSALFLSYTPGDPTTPGYAIKPGEEKSRSDPHYTIPKIPALPISYKEVQPILEKLSGFGPKVEGWKGLVEGFDYSVGPNPNYKLNLLNLQEFKIKTMNNIVGKIEGKDNSKMIIVGNHHDSWTPAAADPHSGSASMLEVIRAFNELTKIGWKPYYSIVFASWDGEEYGLIGSTEFGEYYERELKSKCIAYINSDVSTIGSILKLDSTPLLNNLLKSTANEIKYPNSSLTLRDHFRETNGEKIGTLGSGSDFTVFLEHLGIPSVNMEFINNLESAPVYQYHSLYDSYYWMEKFGDPGFVFHNVLAKYMALVALNLADKPILNFRTQDYAFALSEYFHGLEIPSKWLSVKVECHGKSNDSLADLIKEVKEKLIHLQSKSLSFDEKVEFYEYQYQKWYDLALWEKVLLHYKTKILNKTLMYFERHFLDDEGLNNRPWFKHMIYASGRYTGYKGQELPGLAEAIEDENYDDFFNKLKKFSHVLDKLI